VFGGSSCRHSLAQAIESVQRKCGRARQDGLFGSKEDGFGYNAATDKYENLVKAGVIDPTKVVRSALQNASSIAALLLTDVPGFFGPVVTGERRSSGPLINSRR
jgi:hypothetical protein